MLKVHSYMVLSLGVVGVFVLICFFFCWLGGGGVGVWGVGGGGVVAHEIIL